MTVTSWSRAFVMSTMVAVAGATVLAQAKPVEPAKPATPARPAAEKAKPAPVKLPAAVEAAFKKAYPRAQIKNVSHETEEGVEQYEIESINGGLTLDVNYKPDGTVLVVEEQVAVAEVPAAVVAAISARYPKAAIVRPERMTEKGVTSYEISLKGAPVKSVQLTPEGTWISPKPGK
jgi:hypothetical protein